MSFDVFCEVLKSVDIGKIDTVELEVQFEANGFDFVDMKENYPFTGTGNLYNFCMGLCRINIQNNIIIIFDNDTAGVEKYEKSISLKNQPHLLL